MNKILISLLILTLSLTGCSGGSAQFRSLRDIQRSGVLSVYVNPAGKPFAYMDGDLPAGIEVEIAQKLAEKLGVMPVFTIAGQAEIIAAIQEGEADIGVGKLINTAAARGSVSFTAGTGMQGLFSVARAGEMINTAGALEERIVGVVDGSASEYAMIITPIHPAEIILYPSFAHALAGLINGECEVIAVTEPEALDAVTEHAQLAAEFVINAAAIEFSAMIARGNTELIAQANAVIAELED